MTEQAEVYEKRVWFLISPFIAIPMYLFLIFLTPQSYRPIWFAIWFFGCILSSLFGPSTINSAVLASKSFREYFFLQLGFSFVSWLTIAGLIAAAVSGLFS